MSSEYVPGLEGIIAAQTEISQVDGANGRLVYRGYVIADLAEEMSFEEVAHLLWHGSLPKRAELDALTRELAGSRALTKPAKATLEALPVDDPQVRQPDITRARQLLGWEPQIPLEEGLRRMLQTHERESSSV